MEISSLFSICHLLAVQYVSECPGSVNDTELLNNLLLFLLVKSDQYFAKLHY